MRLIRELRAEIKRLKTIIGSGHLVCVLPLHYKYMYMYKYIILCTVFLQNIEQQGGGTQTVTELFSEDIQRKETQVL